MHLPGFAALSLDVWFGTLGLQASISQVSFPGACLMPQSNEWVLLGLTTRSQMLESKNTDQGSPEEEASLLGTKFKKTDTGW